MRVSIQQHVYELSIDGITKTQELYTDSRVAIESAMSDILEIEMVDKPYSKNSNGFLVSEPLILTPQIPEIRQWAVSVEKDETVLRKHLIQIREVPVITKA